MCLGAFLVIAIIFDKFVEIVAYSISFMVLRSFGGGVHANKPWKCFLFSTGIILICCIISEWSFLSNHLNFILVANVIAWVIVQRWLPRIEYSKFVKGRYIVNITYGIGLFGSLWLMKYGCISLAQFILLSQTFWWASVFLAQRQQNWNNICWHINVEKWYFVKKLIIFLPNELAWTNFNMERIDLLKDSWYQAACNRV